MIWAQIINALLGIWLMASPGMFGYSGIGRINDLIVGPIVATSAIIACWELTRAVGKANVALGVWLVIVPWVLGYQSVIPIINEFVVGVTMIAFALTRGKVRDKFGGGWRGLISRAEEAKQ
jgi:SPW repeat